MNVKITKESLLPLLIYNSPIKYDEYITIYPVTMRDVITFQFLESSITLRKNSIFREKKIIKMTGIYICLSIITLCINGKWTLRQKLQGHLTRQRKTFGHDESHEGN